MECYYHITTCTNPYRNLALEELMLRACRPNRALLYLWQNENTVVIGRNQNAWRECRLDALFEQGGQLARRMTGGGAVYHDMGNQNVSFIADKGCYDLSRQTEVICRAVKHFGLDAQQSGRNDILVEGRKFSGNAFYKTDHAALQHGTILISSDLTRLQGFLAPSPEKLASKGVSSVRGRVINLSELNPKITPEAMRKALLATFEEVYEMVPRPFPMEVLDDDLLEQMTERYGSEEWRLEPRSSMQTQLQKRLSFGDLECHLAIEGGSIKAARVYSDAMDSDWIKRLEESLSGIPFKAEALAKAVPEGEQQEETAHYFSSLSL